MMPFILDWIHAHEPFLWAIVGVSIFTFAASLIVVPWLIVRIPPDYFSRHRPPRKPGEGPYPMARLALRIAKNALGLLFVLAGLLMLILPGQGLLTILTGVLLLNFPGKRRLARWIVSRRPVLKGINWLRRRAHREALVLDSHAEPPGA
jgi:hypothetical protein